MGIKAIHDECDYTAALTLIDRLWDAPAGSPESDQLEVIAILIADYERRQHPIDDPVLLPCWSMSWRPAVSPVKISNPALALGHGFLKC
ncbi:hypothetical protein ACSDBR_05335 [Acidithiobacillus ferriphilus]|uniref:hypothetical protein n=1 Tax=Acidithiobacillus ferriphilus TaxID=1689834 RepID=UPI003F513602